MKAEELRNLLRAINAANQRYWSGPVAHEHASERAVEEATQLAVIAIEKAQKLAAIRARKAGGGRRRASQRREANAERDRRIRAEPAAGKKSKNIATDEKLSPSQVRKIRNTPCP